MSIIKSMNRALATFCLAFAILNISSNNNNNKHHGHGLGFAAAATDAAAGGMNVGGEGGKGVVGFLNRLEGTVTQKTLWFYRYFGQNLNRNKIVGATVDTSCDYDDPKKIKFCPPVPQPPPHVVAAFEARKAANNKKKKTENKGGNNSSNNHYDDNHKGDEAATGQDESDATAVISPEALTKCLDNPEDPACLRLLAGDEKGSLKKNVGKPGFGAVASRTNYVTQMPTGTPTGTSVGLATQEPTRDDCYGNMLDGRFCTSEMPSISDSPTNIPKPKEEVPPGETAFFDQNKTHLQFTNGATLEVCVIEVENVYDSPKAEFGFPIELVSQTGSTITFKISQTWNMSDSIDYIHTVFIATPDVDQRLCVREEDVPFGPNDDE